MKTFVDLFCGVGGFHLAMADLGLECVWACEIDDHAREAYAQNFGIEPEPDIRAAKAADIPDHDVLCAGWPCQPFSIAGARRGFADERGDLFNEVVRVAREKRPSVLLLENVPNILRIDDGAAAKHIQSEIEASGYDYNACILRASDFGVPQMRRRVFFVCPRSDLGWGFWAPQPTSKTACIADIWERGDDGEVLPYPELQVPIERIAWTRPVQYASGIHVGRIMNAEGEVRRTGGATHIHGDAGSSPALTTNPRAGAAAATKAEAVGRLDGNRGQAMAVWMDDGPAPTLCANHGGAVGSEMAAASKLGVARRADGTTGTLCPPVIDEGSVANSFRASGGGDQRAAAHRAPNTIGRVKNKKGEDNCHGVGVSVVLDDGPSPTLNTHPNAARVAVRAGNIDGNKGQAMRVYDDAAPSPAFQANSGGWGGRGNAIAVARCRSGPPDAPILFVRRFTLLEARRVMGWPDDHILSPVKTRARRQIGNGVVPACVKAAFGGLVRE